MFNGVFVCNSCDVTMLTGLMSRMFKVKFNKLMKKVNLEQYKNKKRKSVKH
jgi:hypothetical protein